MAGGDVCSSESFNEDIAVFAKQVGVTPKPTRVTTNTSVKGELGCKMDLICLV